MVQRLPSFPLLRAHGGLDEVAEPEPLIIIEIEVLLIARIIVEILGVHAPLGDLEEDPPIEVISRRFKIINKLICSRLAPRYFLLLDLLILDNIAHKVLHDITLALLQLGFLHELLDAHVVDHVLNVLLPVELFPGNLELLVADPMALVEGPPADHCLLAAARAPRSQRHQRVARIAEPEWLAVVDAFNHLVIIVSRLPILILFLVAIPLLEV